MNEQLSLGVVKKNNHSMFLIWSPHSIISPWVLTITRAPTEFSIEISIFVSACSQLS